jgi:hypothetical protein
LRYFVIIRRDAALGVVRPAIVREFPIAFEIKVTLSRGADGNNESELRANADDLRLEATHAISGATVATDLFVDIADQPNLELLGQELRRAPITMHVDAALVLGLLIGHVVGEAKHPGDSCPVCGLKYV